MNWVASIRTLLIALCMVPVAGSAQPVGGIVFNPLGSFEFSWPYSGYTPLIDRMGRPYVYMATKQLGVVVFDVSEPMDPFPVDTLTVAAMGGLRATGLAQRDQTLFVSLGEFTGVTERAGLAILDVSQPENPQMISRWDSAAFDRGSSTVIVQDEFAYLGAMEHGVVILNIGRGAPIRFVSSIIPDKLFGSKKHSYHARGLSLQEDLLLVAYDNGGLRTIDVSDKSTPRETGKYAASGIDAEGTIFCNHVCRVGQRAFCAMDYCGIEVVDVTDPASMQQLAWINPWGCTSQPPPLGSWNGSPGHCNEIVFSPEAGALFLSGGDTQVLSLDAAQPQLSGQWGTPDDSTGTWGVDVFKNTIALTNVRTPGFPFISTHGGLQLLRWERTVGASSPDDFPANRFSPYPNPAGEAASVYISGTPANGILRLVDGLGRTAKEWKHLDRGSRALELDRLPLGIYQLQWLEGNAILARSRLVIAR
ncbi:MAG: hypothetical protein KBF37_03495 [Saprospiraceae bacterium]|nr:hypothetical protein [Saprospiraceae bacterium]MBP9209366.1 hypothetical protein [Saprospiraceae bacterium]MBV6474226.1 hypothetical protein [Saprospiraceae bacterium]